MTGFKHPALKQLTDQQVRFAPPIRRQEQLIRAQYLLKEVEPGRKYPYQWVCFRITEFRPESYPDLLIDGTDLAHDLGCFIEALTGTMPVTFDQELSERVLRVQQEEEFLQTSPKSLPVEQRVANESLVTLEELSKRWNVSTKTVRRWRKLGLIGRRVSRNGKQVVCYPQALVEQFEQQQRERVDRGSRFSQMTNQEREDILRRARRYCRVGGSLTEISRRIARRLGRSVEAIRYTIKNHDRDFPEQALFPKLTGPLDTRTKESIFTAYHRGITVETLAKTYQRTRTSMYRVINEVRACRLLEVPLDFIPHPDFHNPEREADILAPMPGVDDYNEKRRSMRAPKDVPPELAPLYEVPLLNKDQEQHLFRQMNYLKFKATELRKTLHHEGEVHAHVCSQLLREIEDLQTLANEVKEILINANMRLVVNIAKRHAGQADNFFELLSDGNMSLIRAVEKFDFSRNFKFSTYASWAIMKNFARSIPDEKHRRERFVTGHEEVFDIAPDTRTDEFEVVATQERASHSVNRLLQYLEPREREIIRMRAGLDDAREMTLEEIGQQFGITKERVRQLNARAMKKLRTIAEREAIELP